MSYAQIHTATLIGSRVSPVVIEVDIQPGLPYFSIIGLPDRQIEESKERIRSAIKNSGLEFPLGKITVNLSPSHIPKYGTSFDLGIALGIIRAAAHIKKSFKVWVIGELTLQGDVNPVQRMTVLLLGAWQQKISGCIIPFENKMNSRLVFEVPVSLVSNLKEAVSPSLKQKLPTPLLEPKQEVVKQYSYDLINGQSQAKRALLVALAGGHNLFMSGPPGSGKTMLAKAAIQLLPTPPRKEVLEIATIYSAAELSYDITLPIRPFRSPLHSLTARVLFGGGTRVKPGEVSLAHGGILFLDEFSEIKKPILEALRQPMQDKKIKLQRNGLEYLYLANCLIIAAQNECPCGLKGVNCRCSAGDLERYSRRISEPLYDRFDIFTATEDVKAEGWNIQEKSGALVAESIRVAREVQNARLGEGRTNSLMSDEELRLFAAADPKALAYLNKVSKTFYLSGRGIRNILCVARTIADLGNCEKVELRHIQEAALYRKR